MAAASRSGSWGATGRVGARRERSGPDPEEPVRLLGQALLEPVRPGLDPAVLGKPLRKLGGRLVGVEVLELELLVLGEEHARLQLEEGRHEHEELAAELEVGGTHPGFVPLLEERDDDLDHLHVRQRELFLQDERQQEVERALERIEIEVELANGDSAHQLSMLLGRTDTGRPVSVG